MFFGVGFIVFLVLTTYAYLRVRALFETRVQKTLFTIAYWLFVLSFPCVEILSHSNALAWMRWFLPYGYLSLPYLLYLILIVLGFDLLRGVNRLVKLFPPEKLKAGKARLTAAAILLIVPAAVVLAGKIRNADLKVNEFRIDVPRKASPARQVAIAVASDFHLGEFTDPAMMERFADTVNALNADLLLLPGDLLEADRQDGRADEFAREFRKIHTTNGLFGALGNHESHSRESNLAFFEKSGITVLQDSAVLIDGVLWLVGRKDSRFQGRKSIGELTRVIPDSLPIIVLDHRPTDLESIRMSGADIVVCGHTHNGQLWPLNYITDRIYDVSWGYRKLGSLHVFVTSGVQVWGPPVRTAGDSEIMLLIVTLQ